MYQCDTNSLSIFLDNQSSNKTLILHIIIYIKLMVIVFLAVTQLYIQWVYHSIDILK